VGKLGNRLVTLILRSPAHRLMSGAVLLLTFRGRRSGRWFTTPVQYARADECTLIVVPGRAELKRWWHNLRIEAPVRLRLAGKDVDATAEAIEDDTARVSTALRAYLERFERARRSLAGQRVVVLVHLREVSSEPS